MVEYLEDSNGYRIKYSDIRKAMKDEPFDMSAVGKEAEWIQKAVNQGIDSHLEACYVPERGDSYSFQKDQIGQKVYAIRLYCEVSVESFPVLLRRLFEMDTGEYDEDGNPIDKPDPDGGPARLAQDMLCVLGFDEYGKFVGRDDE